MRSRVSALETELRSLPSLPAPDSNKTVLLVDSSRIQTGVVDLIAQWGLKSIVLHDTDSSVDHDRTLKPDTIVASSIEESIIILGDKTACFRTSPMVTIVLLAPALLEPDTKWCIRNNVISHKYLTTSISPSDLCMALTECFSTHIPRRPSYYILVAEGNMVNQKITKRLLGKCHVDVAENGEKNGGDVREED
ncbi:hypothetical protein D9758_005967 [Tetrapyrgos nigripes]|uniref:Uncharacterized protein n=1 Tax=Tetrapyrgos nigripes TaxID=182062 RepID=A0A8H5G2W9_9AGAR|nr:hypothetical protein D9758_005967 [Tetrapyrgos nigripes]